MKFILTKIDNSKKKCINCVVGSSAITLFGEKNIKVKEQTDIWDPKNNDIKTMINTIHTSSVRNLRIQNKKMEWFGECYMVPSHEIRFDRRPV